jgi:site-specific recombinase XerD
LLRAERFSQRKVTIGGIPITQISKLLGHSSIATTQRYLNLSLDLETTVSDFVPF